MRDADTENIAHRATPWHAAPIAAFVVIVSCRIG